MTVYTDVSVDICNLVACLRFGAEDFYMTTGDAAICISEWVSEGVELPRGLTPRKLADEWNRQTFG